MSNLYLGSSSTTMFPEHERTTVISIFDGCDCLVGRAYGYGHDSYTDAIDLANKFIGADADDEKENNNEN